MGTHPIFESDFDCLTDCFEMADMEEVQPVTIVQQADDIADGEEKTVREFEEPQVQNDQLENQNDKPAVSAISQPVGSGKKWATGEMVTDSKEVFFEQVQLAPAVRDKGSLNYPEWKDLFLSD